MFSILAEQFPVWLRLLLWFSLMAGGIYLVWKGLLYIRLGQESNSWPTIKGRIVKSYLHSHTSTATSQNGTTSSSTSYSPLIHYVYGLHGVQYRSRSMVLGDETLSFSRQEEAEFYLDNYPMNKEVDIFYNPSQPSMSVIIPGRIGYGVKNLIAGIIFLFLCLLVLFLL
jgi:hypothetical protein